MISQVLGSVLEAKRWIKPNLCLQWDYILVQKELNSSLILYLEDTVGTQKKSNQPKIGASGDDAWVLGKKKKKGKVMKAK